MEVLGGIGFTGLVDELKVYNRALTPAEVRGEIAGLTDPAPGGTLDSPAPRALKASFEVANPKPGDVAFHEGDVIRYKLVVTNDTGMTRSFKPVESNLDNWTGCKWSTFQAGATKPCDFPAYRHCRRRRARFFHAVDHVPGVFDHRLHGCYGGARPVCGRSDEGGGEVGHD